MGDMGIEMAIDEGARNQTELILQPKHTQKASAEETMKTMPSLTWVGKVGHRTIVTY